MKHIFLFFTLMTGLAFGQAKQTNNQGANIDTDGDANAFLGKLARGTSITFDELGYLDGVTSGLQTQLDGKLSLSGSETVSGDKTLTGVVKIADQDIAEPTSAVNVATANRLRHFSASAITTGAPSLHTTATTGISTENNQFVYSQLGTDLNSIGKVEMMSWGMGSGGSGDTWNFGVPFIFSGRISTDISNEYISHRIQVGLNGIETIPLKGSDPIPTEERGIGIEFRKEPSGSNLQCRLYARDGYPTVSGTFTASAWENLGANGFVRTFSYVIEHIPSTSTVNLYAKVDYANNASRAGKISETPILTISGAGVPSVYQYVGTNKLHIMALLVPDGTHSPAYCDQLNVWPHTIEIK